MKDGDLSSCYTQERYSRRTNKSKEPALILTKLIEEKNFLEAVRLSKVKGVLVDVPSYSGYLTIDKEYQSNMFFWFIPRESEPERGSLVLWLQGGPGWPSMFGMFKENGPFLLDVDKIGGDIRVNLVRNIHSWHKVANILYIDNPVGTGFSFTRDSAGYPTNDSAVADQLVTALTQFMKLLPYYIPGYHARKNPFFAFGESYGGPFVLSLAQKILSTDGLLSYFNLQGIALGNPLLSPRHQFLYSQFLQTTGYLSQDQIVTLQNYEETMLKLIEEGKSKAALYEYSNMMQYFATELNNTFLASHGFTNPCIYDVNYDGQYLTSHEYICYLQTPRVMQSIHVGSNQCQTGAQSYFYLEDDILTDKVEILESVLDSNKIRVLLYTGNMDMMVHTMGMNTVVKNLKWSKRAQFDSSGSSKLVLPGQTRIAGYYGQGGGLTYLVVRDAGHMVPISQPAVAARIVKQFIGSKEWGC